jgi:alkylation response protein AidB-like acyl-CoA dehydrogenase
MNTSPVAPEKGIDLLRTATKLGPLLSQYTSEEERDRKLSAPVVTALKEAGFFKLYLPESLGGLEADPLTTAKVIEEIARHNTAAGWSLMVANTIVFMGGYLSEKGIEEVFGHADVFICGSIHPPMRARRTEGGFLINGTNPLVSNVHESQWIFVTALVMEGDQLKMNNGHPEIIGAILDAGDCRIIDTWYTLGMCATDSNDVEANEVFVPGHRTFLLVPGAAPGRHFKGPLYKFPVAGANIGSLLAPVSLAVARNAIEELKALADKKTPLGSMTPLRERGVVQRKMGRAVALVQSARAWLHDKLAQCWQRVLIGEAITLEEKAGLLLAAAHANQCSAEAVELVYTASGTSGIYMKNKLAHYFTDAQVLRQHGFMNESRYETAAQVYMGLPPDLPIITF